MAKSSSGVGKAATAIAAGGGPEDPIGDAVAARDMVKKKTSPSPKNGSQSQGNSSTGSGSGSGKPAEKSGEKSGGKSGGKSEGGDLLGGGGKGKSKKSFTAKALGFAWSGSRKVLTAQFIGCILILLLGTVTSPPGSKDDATRAMVKGSALCGVFVILALASAGGGGSAKAATALGTLITAAYLFTSSDVHNLATWASAFFAKPKSQATTGQGTTN